MSIFLRKSVFQSLQLWSNHDPFLPMTVRTHKTCHQFYDDSNLNVILLWLLTVPSCWSNIHLLWKKKLLRSIFDVFFAQLSFYQKIDSFNDRLDQSCHQRRWPVKTVSTFTIFYYILQFCSHMVGNSCCKAHTFKVNIELV